MTSFVKKPCFTCMLLKSIILKAHAFKIIDFNNEALDCNPKGYNLVLRTSMQGHPKGYNNTRSACMGWLIFFMDFCYGRKFFFYVRISIKEKFKNIVPILLLNFITSPL